MIGHDEIDISSEKITNAIGDLKSIKRRNMKEKVVTSSRINDYCDEDLTKIVTVPNLGNVNNMSRFKADMDSFSQNVNIQSSLAQTKIKKQK